MGKGAIFSVIIIIFYVAAGLALNYQGGAIARYMTYFVGCILSLFIFVFVYAVITPLIGYEFDFTILVLGLGVGSIGLSTMYVLIKQREKIFLQGKVRSSTDKQE